MKPGTGARACATQSETRIAEVSAFAVAGLSSFRLISEDLESDLSGQFGSVVRQQAVCWQQFSSSRHMPQLKVDLDVGTSKAPKTNFSKTPNHKAR